ncbi:proline-rich protein 3-like [Juglans microcarpa x Juglans regia]|uniref:proline-rich protein 3-like n=1 Tax=Juglans microcarpa x Juglans regia TaxID=2249226 RepID=UPI001B7DEA6D|nr:proline-rich protein 3-like [Juglans microcarpa x Juglans regia]
MASARFLCSTSILLLSLLVIASAADYGYVPKPDYGNPKPEDNKPLPSKPDFEKPEPEGKDYNPLPTKPDFEKPKPEENDYKPLPTKPEGNDKHLPTKPEYEKPDLDGKDELFSSLIGIQGLVLCKLGSTYVPLKGAVARITCKAVDERGYEEVPLSVLSNECDAKGYFLATLSSSFLKENWKIKECKAFLEHSPLKTCNVPIDVNHGITGALLSSYRILNDNHMKLYSVGPFFYTSETQSLPNGY